MARTPCNSKQYNDNECFAHAYVHWKLRFTNRKGDFPFLKCVLFSRKFHSLRIHRVYIKYRRRSPRTKCYYVYVSKMFSRKKYIFINSYKYVCIHKFMSKIFVYYCNGQSVYIIVYIYTYIYIYRQTYIYMYL